MKFIFRTISLFVIAFLFMKLLYSLLSPSGTDSVILPLYRFILPIIILGLLLIIDFSFKYFTHIKKIIYLFIGIFVYAILLIINYTYENTLIQYFLTIIYIIFQLFLFFYFIYLVYRTIKWKNK